MLLLTSAVSGLRSDRRSRRRARGSCTPWASRGWSRPYSAAVAARDGPMDATVTPSMQPAGSSRVNNSAKLRAVDELVKVTASTAPRRRASRSRAAARRRARAIRRHLVHARAQASELADQHVARLGRPRQQHAISCSDRPQPLDQALGAILVGHDVGRMSCRRRASAVAGPMAATAARRARRVPAARPERRSTMATPFTLVKMAQRYVPWRRARRPGAPTRPAARSRSWAGPATRAPAPRGGPGTARLLARARDQDGPARQRPHHVRGAPPFTDLSSVPTMPAAPRAEELVGELVSERAPAPAIPDRRREAPLAAVRGSRPGRQRERLAAPARACPATGVLQPAPRRSRKARSASAWIRGASVVQPLAEVQAHARRRRGPPPPGCPARARAGTRRRERARVGGPQLEPGEAGGASTIASTAPRELPEPGVDVAPDRLDHEVGPQRQPRRAAAGSRCRRRARRQIVERAGRRASRARRAGLRAAGTRRGEARGQLGRQVLQAVDGEVDVAVEERLLDLPHEQPLAADVGEARLRRASPASASARARPRRRARAAVGRRSAWTSASRLPRVPDARASWARLMVVSRRLAPVRPKSSETSSIQRAPRRPATTPAAWRSARAGSCSRSPWESASSAWRVSGVGLGQPAERARRPRPGGSPRASPGATRWSASPRAPRAAPRNFATSRSTIASARAPRARARACSPRPPDLQVVDVVAVDVVERRSTPGSTFRGTPMSMKNSGRPRRACSACDAARGHEGSGAAVEAITMSTCVQRRVEAVEGTAVPASSRASSSAAAQCGWRRTRGSAPCSTRWRAASSLILPAPMRSMVLPSRLAEDLPRELHRGERDRHRVPADLGLGAHPLGDGERRVNSEWSAGPTVSHVRERRRRPSPGRGSAARPPPSSRGSPRRGRRGCTASSSVVRVEQRLDGREAGTPRWRQRWRKMARARLARHLGDAVDLDAVAGRRRSSPLRACRRPRCRASSSRTLSLLDGQPLAQLHRRSPGG